MEKKSRAKKFFSDFKAFITKGNIIDLAIAVIIGGAFGKIVSSLVNDIIMPLISLLIGGVSVKDWKWVISPAVYNAEGILTKAETALTYGNFLQTVLDFLIIAFFVFLALRIVASLQGQLEKIEKNLSQFTDEEQREFVKQLKAQGLSKEEIAKRLKEEKEKKQAELQAATFVSAPETIEDILRDIRELLTKTETK